MKLKDLLYKTQALPYVFFLLNFLLKFIFIDTQDICIDEPFTIYHAQFGVSDIITFLKPTNNPPLFEILLHYWIKLFGISPVSVRFLPVVFSSLAVIFIYKTANKLFGPIVAFIASVIFSCSSYQYYYAHDARAYSLFLLLSITGLFLFISILKDSNSIKNKVLFSIINVLLIYTHYFGFIVLFVQFVYLLFLQRNKLKDFFLLYVFSLLFFIPQLLVFFQRTFDSATQGTWIEVGIGIESLYNKLVLFSNMPVVAVLCIALMLAYVIKLFFVKSTADVTGSDMKNNLLLISLWFFAPFFIMFLVSYKVPVFLDRYLIFITPAFYILVAYLSYSVFDKKQINGMAASLIVIAFIATLNINPSKKREAKKAVEYVMSKKESKTLVIICAHDFINNFTYYYNQKIFTGITAGNEYKKLTAELNAENVYPIRTISELPSEKLNKFEKVIFLDAAADFSNPGNRIYETLIQGYTERNKTHFKNIFNVYEFDRN